VRGSSFRVRLSSVMVRHSSASTVVRRLAVRHARVRNPAGHPEASTERTEYKSEPSANGCMNDWINECILHEEEKINKNRGRYHETSKNVYSVTSGNAQSVPNAA
jgi:hypothetical protein